MGCLSINHNLPENVGTSMRNTFPAINIDWNRSVMLHDFRSWVVNFVNQWIWIRWQRHRSLFWFFCRKQINFFWRFESLWEVGVSGRIDFVRIADIGKLSKVCLVQFSQIIKLVWNLFPWFWKFEIVVNFVCPKSWLSERRYQESTEILISVAWYGLFCWLRFHFMKFKIVKQFVREKCEWTYHLLLLLLLVLAFQVYSCSEYFSLFFLNLHVYFVRCDVILGRVKRLFWSCKLFTYR